jgi:hypothetical protein
MSFIYTYFCEKKGIKETEYGSVLCSKCTGQNIECDKCESYHNPTGMKEDNCHECKLILGRRYFSTNGELSFTPVVGWCCYECKKYSCTKHMKVISSKGKIYDPRHVNHNRPMLFKCTTCIKSTFN